jgi:hypothetical protein
LLVGFWWLVYSERKELRLVADKLAEQGVSLGPNEKWMGRAHAFAWLARRPWSRREVSSRPSRVLAVLDLK